MRGLPLIGALLAMLGPAAALGPFVGPGDLWAGVLEPGDRLRVVPPGYEALLVTYAFAAEPGASPPAHWVYVLCSDWTGRCHDHPHAAAWAGHALVTWVFDSRVGLDLVAEGTLAYAMRVGPEFPGADVCPEPAPLTNLCYSDDDPFGWG